MKRKPAGMALKLATTAIFTAIVCVATLVLVVNIPATEGYFNIGETMVYVSALLFGPFVGAFAGGIGAAIADLLVAPLFAPGTLVIKGCEGAIVGFLNKKMPGRSSARWKTFSALLGVVVGTLLAVTGSMYYQNPDIYLGYPPSQTPTVTLSIPAEAWYLAGGILALTIALMGFKLDPESGRGILSILVGGLEMIAGYFLYELLVLGKVLATAEVAANILQVLVGLTVAIPVARAVFRRFPQLVS